MKAAVYVAAETFSFPNHPWLVKFCFMFVRTYLQRFYRSTPTCTERLMNEVQSEQLANGILQLLQVVTEEQLNNLKLLCRQGRRICKRMNTQHSFVFAFCH